MPGCKNQGVMVTDGAHTVHQLLGTVSRFIRSKEFCKGSIMCPCETLHGQHFDCSLCEAPRGSTISSSVQFGSGPMGVGSQSEFFLSAEHLARRMNVMAGWQSRHFTDSRIGFPSFCLIIWVLAKLREFDGELILATQLWPSQAWYPTFLDMSVLLPVLLPIGNNLLLGPQGEIHLLILNMTLQLATWHVANAPCSRRAFVQMLPSSSWQLGGQAQMQFITPPGRNGIAGISDRRLIHFAPLWQI